MGKIAKAVLVGSTLGLGYVVIRGVRNAYAAEIPNGETPTGATETRPTGAPWTPASAIPIEPGEGPETPLREPEHATPNRVINQSYYNKKTGTVRESPTQLLMQALRYDPDVTLEELTGARLAKSEHGSGSFT